MNLLDELGIEAESLEWQKLAACKNFPFAWFFDDYESDPEIAKAADQACLSCPVMKECAMAGMKGEWGLWGGTYWNGGGKPDKLRNAHKTPEIWQQISEKISG